jgi:chaperonin cofactor prefoldin
MGGLKMNKKDEKACLDNRIGVLEKRVEALEERIDDLLQRIAN